MSKEGNHTRSVPGLVCLGLQDVESILCGQVERQQHSPGQGKGLEKPTSCHCH